MHGASALVEGRPYPPDPKVLRVWRVSNALSSGILFLLASLITIPLALKGEMPLLLLAPLVIVVLGLVSQLTLQRQFASWRYTLHARTLEMEHGWFWRQRRVVRRDRIQHIDVNSGPLDRRFGLVQVVVYTAGTTVGMIPGLTPERAEALRAALVAMPGPPAVPSEPAKAEPTPETV